MKQRVYQIRVRGQLDSRWSEWFDGWAITHEEDGTTMLTGRVPDQAAVHGLLVKVRNLNLPLISAKPIEPDLGGGTGASIRG